MPVPENSLNYADLSAILPLIEARLSVHVGIFAQGPAAQKARLAELQTLESLLRECLELEKNFSGLKSAKTQHIQTLVLQIEHNMALLETAKNVLTWENPRSNPMDRIPPLEEEMLGSLEDFRAYQSVYGTRMDERMGALRSRLIVSITDPNHDKAEFQEYLYQLKLYAHLQFYLTRFHAAASNTTRQSEIYAQFLHEHSVMIEGTEAANYLGLDIGRELAGFIAGSIPTERSKLYLKDPMSWFNRGRLYWVWGNTTLTCVLEKLPDWLGSSDKSNPLPGSKETCGAIAGISVYTGYLSFILYYARFAIELFLLLKNTLLLSAEEAQEKSRSSRLKDQWQQRKFMLLNDSIWATANLVCFFWLVGSNTLCLTGDILTVALLVMDTVLTIWRFKEEQQQYENQKAFLQSKFRAAKNSEETKLFQGMQAELDRNWQQKKLYTAIDLAYSIVLMASFALHVAISNTPMLKIMLGPLGAAMCFSVGILQSIVTNGLELHKINAQLAEAIKQRPNADKPFDEVAYLEAMQRYQIVKGCMNFFVEASFPVVFYFAFTCLSGLAGGAAPWLVAAAFLIVTIVLPKILEPVFKPNQEKYQNRLLFPETAPTSVEHSGTGHQNLIPSGSRE